jgi:hypothetical protein
MLKSIINDFKREIFVSYDKLIWEFKSMFELLFCWKELSQNEKELIKGIQIKNIDGHNLLFNALKKSIAKLPLEVLDALRESKAMIVFKKADSDKKEYGGFFYPAANFIVIHDLGFRF